MDTRDLNPDKECQTCSTLCLLVRTIGEKVDAHDQTVDMLRGKIMAMEVRISICCALAGFAGTIIADKIFK